MSLLGSIGSTIGGALSNFKLPKLDLGSIGKDILTEGKALLGDVVKDSFQLSNKPGAVLNEDLSLNVLGNNITLPNPATKLANKLLGSANDFLGKEGINVDFKQLLGNVFHLSTEAGGDVAVPGVADRMGATTAANSSISSALAAGASATGGGSVQASDAVAANSAIAATGGGVTSTGSVSTTTLAGSSSVDNLVSTFGSASDKLDGLMNSINDSMSPADLAKVQAQIQKYQQLMSTLSDLLKKDGDMKMNTIGNLRG